MIPCIYTNKVKKQKLLSMKSLKKGTGVKWKFIRANLVDKRKKMNTYQIKLEILVKTKSKQVSMFKLN